MADMTLDFAIKHAEEAAERLMANCETNQCGLEHKQLAEWLKELKERRKNDNRNIY